MKIYRTLYDLIIDKPTEVSSRAEAILGCPYYEDDGELDEELMDLARIDDRNLINQIPDDKIDEYMQEIYCKQAWLFEDGDRLGFYNDKGIWEDGEVIKHLITNADILQGLYIIELEDNMGYIDGALDFSMPRDMAKMREYGLKQLEIMREFQFYRQNFKPELNEELKK